MAEALSDFLEAVQKNRYDFVLHLNIGLILWHEKNDLGRAAQYLEEAARYARHPSPYCASVALTNLGKVRRLRGELESAYSAAAEAVQLYPQLSAASYDLALYCSLTGRFEECVQALGKAITMDVLWWERVRRELDGDLGPATSHVSLLGEALRREQQGVARQRIDDAKEQVEAAREAHAERWGATEFAEAVAHYQRAQDLFSRDAHARELFSEDTYPSLLDVCPAAERATELAKLARQCADKSRHVMENAWAETCKAQQAFRATNTIFVRTYAAEELALARRTVDEAEALFSQHTLEAYEAALDRAARAVAAAQEAGRAARSEPQRRWKERGDRFTELGWLLIIGSLFFLVVPFGWELAHEKGPLAGILVSLVSLSLSLLNQSAGLGWDWQLRVGPPCDVIDVVLLSVAGLAFAAGLVALVLRVSIRETDRPSC
jgi:tetratricopeptide (TPR) repeat protein